jgi:hypothetical protein
MCLLVELAAAGTFPLVYPALFPADTTAFYC